MKSFIFKKNKNKHKNKKQNTSITESTFSLLAVKCFPETNICFFPCEKILIFVQSNCAISFLINLLFLWVRVMTMDAVGDFKRTFSSILSFLSSLSYKQPTTNFDINFMKTIQVMSFLTKLR